MIRKVRSASLFPKKSGPRQVVPAESRKTALSSETLAPHAAPKSAEPLAPHARPEIGRAASAGPSSSSGTVYIVERQARTLDNSSLRTDIEFKAKIPATSDTVTGLLKNIFRRPPVGCRPSFSRKITCGVTPYTPIGQMVAAGYYLKGRSSPFVAAESFQSFQDSQNQEKISPMPRNVAVRKGVAVRFCTGSLFRLRRPGRFFPIRSSLLGACPRPLPVYPSQRSRNSYPRRGLFLSRTSRI